MKDKYKKFLENNEIYKKCVEEDDWSIIPLSDFWKRERDREVKELVSEGKENLLPCLFKDCAAIQLLCNEFEGEEEEICEDFGIKIVTTYMTFEELIQEGKMKEYIESMMKSED